MGKWFNAKNKLPTLSKRFQRQRSECVIVKTHLDDYEIDYVTACSDGVIFHGELAGLYEVDKWTKIPKEK